MIDAIALEAAESRAHRADQFGQAELTRSERSRLESRTDWDGRLLFHAQSAKAVLQGSGVDDWLAYYDPQLTVDEHRSIAEQARRDERGARMDEHAREGAFDAMAAGAVGAPVQQRERAADEVIELCMELSDEHDPDVFRAILSQSIQFSSNVMHGLVGSRHRTRNQTPFKGSTDRAIPASS